VSDPKPDVASTLAAAAASVRQGGPLQQAMSPAVEYIRELEVEVARRKAGNLPQHVYVVQKITKTGMPLAAVYDNPEEARKHQVDAWPIVVHQFRLQQVAPESWQAEMHRERRCVAMGNDPAAIRAALDSDLFCGLTNDEIRGYGCALTDDELDALRPTGSP